MWLLRHELPCTSEEKGSADGIRASRIRDSLTRYREKAFHSTSDANRPARGVGGNLGDVCDQPKIADAASELLQDVFGEDKNPCRSVYGVASLPLGTPVELEIIFEVVA